MKPDFLRGRLYERQELCELLQALLLLEVTEFVAQIEVLVQELEEGL